MAKLWTGFSHTAGSVATTEVSGTEFTTPAPSSTLLRTRAHAQLSYSDHNVPAFYPGNQHESIVLRILMNGIHDALPTNWPYYIFNGDDVVCSGFDWDTPVWVPVNAPPTRPENFWQTAKLAEGIADSRAQRKDAGFGELATYWSINPLDSGGAPIDVLFTAAIWVRQLWEVP